jgi:uncharacterized protein YbcI
MKTQGEIEAAICAGVSRFEQETRGRGPKGIHAHLLGDFVVVRLHSLLTPAEQQLARIPSEKGRDLLKQVRTHLIETAKPLLQALVTKITAIKVVSLHHDISTVTGEGRVCAAMGARTGQSARQMDSQAVAGTRHRIAEGWCRAWVFLSSPNSGSRRSPPEGVGGIQEVAQRMTQRQAPGWSACFCQRPLDRFTKSH